MTRPFDIIVPAAGTGTRMQASLRRGQDISAQLPKQYLELAGVAILERTLSRLLELNPRRLCLVVAAEDNYWQQLPSSVHCEVTLGGETRAESVQAGLAALDADEQELVLVHDSVRPLFDLEVVRQLLDRAETSPNGAILASPVIDTLKQSNDGVNISQSVDRQHYWLAQTPQAFPAGLLKRALDTSLGGDSSHSDAITDEASAVEALGLTPQLVPGPRTNIKITTAEDLALAEFLLQREHC